MEEEEGGPARNVGELTLACIELAAKLDELQDQEEKMSCIDEHIKTYTSNQIPMIDFESGLEWFNVGRPLSLEKDLEGRVSVLDFFTYCCINCLHILPDLEALEEVHPPTTGDVLVVGVHSAKFENERVSANIQEAIKRYHIHHPVVNDAQAVLWTKLGIACWPTLLILGPSGSPLFVLVGEGHRERLLLYVNTAVQYFSKQSLLIRFPVPLSPSTHLEATGSILMFPGKVAVYPSGIIVSDSGHNRIILADTEGIVKVVIGSGRRGFSDGCFTSTSFNNPQGVTFLHPNTIFVADTDNHAIRQVDLLLETVTTIAGTGQQGTDLEGGNLGASQAISSPWDVCLGRSVDQTEDQVENLLLVAMAGSHQIWGIFLSDGQWLKGSSYKQGTVVRLAGSGSEENRNTTYPLKAGFAQPSGVTLSSWSGEPELYIADAESSSVRKFNLKNGAVKSVVGGARDPLDLFAYGDTDGSGVEARLQHPLAVACVDQAIYVADSYNHKIKVIHPSGKKYTISTVVGSNSLDTDMKLNEPGGVCVSLDGSCLYIADTNNHTIKILSLKDSIPKEFPLHLIDESDSPSQDFLNDNTSLAQLVTVTLPMEEKDAKEQREREITLRIILELPENASLNKEAPNKWKLEASELDFHLMASQGKLEDIETEVPLTLSSTAISGEIEMKLTLCCVLFVCLTSGMCVKTTSRHCVIFKQGDSQNSGSV
ncbi:hypothetical protein Pcinc_021523 [Petrolisthes cinctipes]|uniref:Thioredoxin domain-containing protein n=1 Tax=Petrolisthes cinctipes TaxID=88211 RepID=A0AAE1FH20_PETCI|nr:hypothetical protein Pcinc_021523 [Petrolisthes cinctipes]